MLALGWMGGPLARRLVRKRLQRGKEDPERIGERFGQPSLPRPKGRLAWFHAASVGESLSLLALVDGLLAEHDDLHVLLTTGTRTSAELLATRLPPRALHQYVPVDTPSAVGGFLKHWQPDIAIWTESELWPRLIVMTHDHGCPMLLINARMSVRSARRLARVQGYAASLLGRFNRVLAQDDAQGERLRTLGASNVTVTGSLKDTAEPLPHDEAALRSFRAALGGRTVWLAASTHPGEEAMAAQAQREARRRFPGLLLILVPRHPERGPQIARSLRADGWSVALRSAGEMPERDTDIYLADTLGELGLWYRLAAVSFVGGSLVDVGGHNPFEPALLGSAILTGPHVQNFETAYGRFRRAGAAAVVPKPADLGGRLIEILPPDRSAALATAAWTVSSEGADVARRVLNVISQQLSDAGT